jgi:hypothetical protein
MKIGAPAVERGFLYFIIGCILLAPLIFLVVRLNIYLHKKHLGETYEPPHIDDSDPTDPRSLAGIRHRINPPPG